MVDYRGFIRPRSTGRRPSLQPDESQQLLTLQFTWKDAEDGSIDLKPVSSSFIGVSPEFEIALYTLCFLAGGEVRPWPFKLNRAARHALR